MVSSFRGGGGVGVSPSVWAVRARTPSPAQPPVHAALSRIARGPLLRRPLKTDDQSV